MDFVAVTHSPADQQAIVYVHVADDAGADYAHRSYTADEYGADYLDIAMAYARGLAAPFGYQIDVDTL
jgi:hypothetical protein